MSVCLVVHRVRDLNPFSEAIINFHVTRANELLNVEYTVEKTLKRCLIVN